MTTAVGAKSIPSGLNKILSTGEKWRVMHLFAAVCNMVNTRGDVLSIVDTSIGNGPFNVVVVDDAFFSFLSTENSVSVSIEYINVGEISISLSHAAVWEARPDWEKLHGQNENLMMAVNQIEQLLILEAQPDSFAHLIFRHTAEETLAAPIDQVGKRALSNLREALPIMDIHEMAESGRWLAGLGRGLTPAGDDFMMGVMHALWAAFPEAQAGPCCHAIKDGMIAETTHLSAAWLRAAANGNAGEAWHRLFKAISSGKNNATTTAARAILPTGHSSGADALGGFTFALRRLLE